jgi:heptosyltransferase-2
MDCIMAKKILIIHTAFIGDIVLSTPLIRRLKESAPESYLHYLTTPMGREILETNPHLDQIIAYDKRGADRGILGFIRLCRKLHGFKYDTAIIPHRYLRSSLIAFFAKIPRRIGFSNSEGRLFLTHTVPYRRGIHEVERLLMLAE